MSKDITKVVSENITKPVKLANIKKQWLLADATGKVLGRFASKIANIARGKNKPFYTPFLDCGDNIIVINAEKIMLTGDKAKKKMYISYSGYPGGQKIKSFSELDPCEIMRRAINGMIPKNKLGRKICKNIRIFAGSNHNMQSVNPITINI